MCSTLPAGNPTFGGTAPASGAGTLFAALHGELHRLARPQLRRGGPDLSIGSIGATTLVHEAYLAELGRAIARAARVPVRLGRRRPTGR